MNIIFNSFYNCDQRTSGMHWHAFVLTRRRSGHLEASPMSVALRPDGASKNILRSHITHAVSGFLGKMLHRTKISGWLATH